MIPTAAVTAPPPAAHAAATADSYLTDGRRLFRVVAPLDPALGLGDAVLEDCETLSWRVYRAMELWRMRLRQVRTPGIGT